MLVTFQSQNAADVIMFEKDARAMLKLMGRQDTIPGAIYPEDVSEALVKLREGAEADGTDSEAQSDAAETPDPDESETVSTRNRAFPLIRLLETAARDGKHVMWDGKQSAEADSST